MMANTWISGKINPVKWLVTGGSLVTLNVTDHTYKEMVDKLLTDHTGTGGIQSLIAGFFRANCNVKANLDVDAPWYVTGQFIRAGAFGQLLHYVSSSANAKAFAIPCMITEVNNASPATGLVSYDFNVELCYEAGTFGYPSA